MASQSVVRFRKQSLSQAARAERVPQLADFKQKKSKCCFHKSLVCCVFSDLYEKTAKLMCEKSFISPSHRPFVSFPSCDGLNASDLFFVLLLYVIFSSCVFSHPVSSCYACHICTDGYIHKELSFFCVIVSSI